MAPTLATNSGGTVKGCATFPRKPWKTCRNRARAIGEPIKGIVFNLLEDVVTREHGADTWDVLLADAGLDGVYTSLGSYPDGDLLALVGAASARLSTDADDVVRWFGREALPMLADEYPQFFAAHSGAIPFLMTLNDVIHPEVRKIYPGADVPLFDFERPGPDELIMGYASPRHLCSLAEGFIEGAATRFGEEVRIVQTACMKDGADRCRLVITTSR